MERKKRAQENKNSRKILLGGFLLLVLFLFGCTATLPEENLFQYKGAYVGDASRVGRLARSLPGGEDMASMELKTGEEPYGIRLYYEPKEALSAKMVTENAVETAAYLFTLVQNVSFIEFHHPRDVFALTREDLETWLGGDALYALESEEALRDVLRDPLANKIHEAPISEEGR